MYRVRRRRAVLVLLLAVTAFAAPRLVNNAEDRSYVPGDKHRSYLPDHKHGSYAPDHKHRSYLSTNGWPIRGQGAYVLGNGRPAVSMRIGIPLAEATMRLAISSPLGPGMSRSRTAMS